LPTENCWEEAFLPPSIFKLFFGRGQIDCPITNFLGTFGHSPIETNMLPYGPPFQFGYMGVEVWANHVG